MLSWLNSEGALRRLLRPMSMHLLTELPDVFSSRPMFGLVELTCSKSRWSLTMTSLRKGLVLNSIPYNLIHFHRNRENYIHRIGRSGRFGRKGVAINVRLACLSQ